MKEDTNNEIKNQGSLMKLIQELGKGNFFARIEIKEQDGFERNLSEALNKMADQLQLDVTKSRNTEISLLKLRDVLTSYSKGDFDQRFDDQVNDNMVMGLGAAVNLMGEELRENTVSLGYFRSVINLIEDPILILNPKTGSIIDKNVASIERFGHLIGELENTSILTLMSAMNLSYDDILSDLKKNKIKAVRGDFSVKGTKPFPGTAIMSYIPQEERIIVIIHDETSRVLSETRLSALNSKLLKSHESFNSIVQKSVDGIMVTDNQGNIHFVNPSTEVMLGKSSKTLLGQKLGIPISVGDMTEMDIILPNGEVGIAEMRLVNTIWNNLEANLIFLRNITIRKHTELELKAKNEAITRMNEEYETFTYVVSHDLKAPISNLASLIGVLKPHIQKGDEQIHQIYQHMLTTLGQMNGIIRGLNEVLTLKKGLNVDLEEIEFEEVYSEIEFIIRKSVQESKAEIQVDFSECKKISFARVHLRSIIQNLMTNAIKYRSKNRPLKIKVRSYIENSRKVLSVSDNGLGLDMKLASAKLFGLFQRFHKNREGKGIGLHMLNSIVQNYGGSIEVESEVEVGTTFKIILGNA